MNFPYQLSKSDNNLKRKCQISYLWMHYQIFCIWAKKRQLDVSISLSNIRINQNSRKILFLSKSEIENITEYIKYILTNVSNLPQNQISFSEHIYDPCSKVTLLFENCSFKIILRKVTNYFGIFFKPYEI